MSEESQEESRETRLYTAASTAYDSRLLTQLSVSNMKALAGDHLIPLAPLTLVYGPNGAGKSSVIQSLMLLAQSVRAGAFAPHGPLVDVRDFRHAVNGHDESKELTIGIRFLVQEEDSDAVMIESPKVEIEEVLPLQFEGGVALTFRDSDNGRPPSAHASLDVGGATLSEPNDPVPVLDGFDEASGPYGPFNLRWMLELDDSLAAESLAAAVERWHPDNPKARGAAALIRVASDLVEAGRAKLATLHKWVEPIEWQQGLHAPSDLRLSLEPADAVQVGRSLIQIHGRGLLPEDEAAIETMLARWEDGNAESTTFDGFASVVGLFARVEEEARGLLQSDLLGEDSSPAARRYRETRDRDHRPEAELVRLGPIRPTPRRVHLEDEVSDAAALTLIRRLHRSERLLGSVNEWLERLEIPYTIEVDRLISRRSGIERGYSFELTDTRTNVEVSLVDVGYGVSQILPIIVECVGANGRIICIEQPELHLHPRLAANLAELLADTVSRGNQIIAETHSENILLRVQRLVREGRIAASDVAVLYVDNTTATGAQVTRLHLDAEGDLQDRWPGGFFDDRLADVLGVPS